MSSQRWRDKVIKSNNYKDNRQKILKQQMMTRPLFYGESYGVINRQEAHLINTLRSHPLIKLNDIDNIECLTQNLKDIAKLEKPKNTENINLHEHLVSCVAYYTVSKLDDSPVTKSKISYTTTGSIPLRVNIDRWKDGGGYSHRHIFVKILQEKNRKFKNCLEWCSGVGTIGYDLYSHEITENLSLLDKNPWVITTAKQIAKTNQILNKVKFYTFDSISFLPKDQQFDLIIGNPPFFFNETDTPHMSIQRNNKIEKNWIGDNLKRLGVDKNWESHIDFFRHIRDFVTDDGLILLSGHKLGSSVDDFNPIIENNKLKIINVHMIPNLEVYFMEIKKS